MNIQERFDDKWMPEPNSGCHLWLASVDMDGYGLFLFEGRLQSAHRVEWKLKRGPIPTGLLVLHHCDVTCCVNEHHLYIGTQQRNMRDAFKRNRLPTIRQIVHSDAVLKAVIADPRKQKTIAEEYGLNQSTVSNWKKWGARKNPKLVY